MNRQPQNYYQTAPINYNTPQTLNSYQLYSQPSQIIAAAQTINLNRENNGKVLHKCEYCQVKKISGNNGIQTVKILRLPLKGYYKKEKDILENIIRSGKEFNIVTKIIAARNSQILIYSEYQDYGTMRDCIEYGINKNQKVEFSV